MTSTKKNIIVYTFQSLEDPLVKGLMLQYLTSLAVKDNLTFHLITHEQKSFKLSEAEMKQKKENLADNNILWYPINYHKGRFLIFKKLYDFLVASYICFKVKIKYNTKVIIGFLPIAAGFSAILAPVLRLKLITYCFEPHSEYMVDFKIWSRKSWKFALLRKYERTQLEISSAVIVPTFYTKELVEKYNPYNKKYVLPISIDTEKNIFNEKFRNEFREKNNLGNKKIILYLGKFGGIYYDTPTFMEFLYKFEALGDYHALIISSDFLELENYLQKKHWDESFFTLHDFIPYDQIHNYISIADIGIVAVPPLPSQKYRTPVKTGLYLSCGIPYLINKGVAEDDRIALTENVGWVVDDLTHVDMNELNQKIITLLRDENLRNRCRETAVNHRSHKKAVEVLREVIKDNYI